MSLSIVILAAGDGKRMKSRLPKVLHDLGGQPLLAHVLAAARALGPGRIYLVHGKGAEAVRAAFPESDLEFVMQSERLGTGHALMQAMPAIPDEDMLLVLYGDVPLIRHETLRALIGSLDESRLAVLSMHADDPTGYGRIVRDAGHRFLRIVEQKDATADELAVQEVNTGIMAGHADALRGWLDRLTADNSQGEYYLTDCIGLAVADGLSVSTARCEDPEEAQGINDRIQLARAERALQGRRVEALMAAGASLRDPGRVDIRGEVKSEPDVVIDVNVVFEGDVELGEEVGIGPNCLIRNARLGARTQVLANSVIEDAEIGCDCRVGPFSRIRPATELADHVHVGNFVEIKKSRVAEASKINHLSYIGDSEVGERVNIGAGTITCNYDGANKHRTVIGDDVFIGSDTQLVAPVSVGDGATVGAGSTITTDTPAGTLSLSRAPQKVVPGWRRPKKKP